MHKRFFQGDVRVCARDDVQGRNQLISHVGVIALYELSMVMCKVRWSRVIQEVRVVSSIHHNGIWANGIWVRVRVFLCL